MNILDERDKRTIYRKIAKKNFDKEISLSVSDTGQRVRLLDEGMVVDAYGDPLFYIQKGTLASYYNSLADDYVGSINVGHMDFPTFPFLLGQWEKKDLHLVDIGDGRQALDVDLRLDYDNYLVKTLQASPYDVGVSAEFTFHVNEEASKRNGIEILDAIFIRDFAIVGECGNVNSSGINLKGGPDMDLKDLSAKIEAEMQKDGTTIDDIKEIILSVDLNEETEEEPEEVMEESVEDEQNEEESSEDTVELNVSEVLEQLSALKERVDALEARKQELETQNEAVIKENEELKEKLSVKSESDEKILEVLKSLNLSVAHEEQTIEPVVTPDYTDGIGEE